MIQESYVTFEQAKALKELGFPQEWIEHPKSTIWLTEHKNEYHPKDVDMEGYACPTLSLVQKWLREEKNLHIVPLYESWPNIHYHLQINDDDILYQDSPGYSYSRNFETYEQALSAGIDKCIELLKQ